MARKPIELERVLGAGKRLLSPRERMWEAMCTLVLFTPSQISDKAHPVSMDAATSYLDGLVNAGFVHKVASCARRPGAKGFCASKYRVVRLVPVAPMLDKHGKPVTPPLGVLAMWRAMKIRRVFDVDMIAADATQGVVACPPATAAAYIKHLNAAGYLREEAPAQRGPGRTPARYRLMRDTGPLPPAVTRAKVVYDRNLGELFAAQTAQEVCDAAA